MVAPGERRTYSNRCFKLLYDCYHGMEGKMTGFASSIETMRETRVVDRIGASVARLLYRSRKRLKSRD